jgi:hypothetical protein
MRTWTVSRVSTFRALTSSPPMASLLSSTAGGRGGMLGAVRGAGLGLPSRGDWTPTAPGRATKISELAKARPRPFRATGIISSDGMLSARTLAGHSA